MENKGLLKLPNAWHIVITEENRSKVKEWYSANGDYCYDLGCGYGTIEGKPKSRLKEWLFEFGQEITFADFKRLVLGEKNYEDYGVLGCEELKEYFIEQSPLNGDDRLSIYFLKTTIWDCQFLTESKRQTLPLQEYLKLIEPETMEKKYEYKLRDEKYIEPILKLIDRKIDFTFPLREEIVPNTITILRDLNVLDLFFEKIEVKELPIIGGSKPEVSEDGDLIEIAGFQIDMYIIDHFKSFTLGNDVHVSESDIKQIREYLKQNKE